MRSLFCIYAECRVFSSPPEPVIRGSVVIALSHDLFASDIEICKHISASLSSYVIPATEPESGTSEAAPAEAPAEETVAETAAEEKPLIVGIDECPAEEEEEGGAPDIIGALVEALESVPANLAEVFGSLTDPLGTTGELEGQEAAELKKETLDKITDAKVLTCEEYAAIETFGEEEEDEKTREAVFAKLAAAEKE